MCIFDSSSTCRKRNATANSWCWPTCDGWFQESIATSVTSYSCILVRRTIGGVLNFEFWFWQKKAGPSEEIRNDGRMTESFCLSSLVLKKKNRPLSSSINIPRNRYPFDRTSFYPSWFPSIVFPGDSPCLKTRYILSVSIGAFRNTSSSHNKWKSNIAVTCIYWKQLKAKWPNTGIWHTLPNRERGLQSVLVSETADCVPFWRSILLGSSTVVTV